jgi:UDP-N-acetyl-D-mannosaminuronate dehydrogenase
MNSIAIIGLGYVGLPPFLRFAGRASVAGANRPGKFFEA